MRSYSKLASFIQCLAISILVTSCGGGGGGAAPSTTPNQIAPEVPEVGVLVISGTVAKGIVKNGLVLIYGVTNGVRNTDPFSSTTTDSEGNYEFSLSESLFDISLLENDPIVIQVIAVADTTMTCDAVGGCGVYSFGDDVPIAGGDAFSLEAVIPDLTRADPVVTNISTLTTMASRVATDLGINSVNVNAANSQVAALFQIVGNLTELGVVDITRPDVLALADPDVQRGSILSAAILAEGLESGLSIGDVVENFVSDYSSENGRLINNENVDSLTITLEEIYEKAIQTALTYSDNSGIISLANVLTAELLPISTASTGTLSEGGSTDISFQASSSFASACNVPRTGIDSFTGLSFTDTQGSLLLENQWLRSWTDEFYLWYDEVNYANPEDFVGDVTGPWAYFDTLKTLALTPSGAPKDQFHFAVETEVWNQLNQSGVTASYGATFYIGESPQRVIVSYVEPGSPAANAGFVRGTEIIEIEPVPVSTTDINILAIALYPATVGESYTFIVRHPGAGSNVTEVLTSASVTSTPVLNTSVINTGTGDVGYILFNEHIATSELQLFNAFTTLDVANVTDLVLDLRYNGGGLLAIAAQTAYMIAGSTATNGMAFETLTFNDKYPVNDPFTGEPIEPFPFFDQGLGFSLQFGVPLPSLDLTRVYILTSPGTCSASESIINSLRGINVEVVLVGAKTCGKPYGFIPEDNCGTTYFSIQFSGENALSFGDYSDGFSPQNWINPSEGVLVPGCTVADDFNTPLGDPSEAILNAALQYRDSNSCPIATTLSTPESSSQPDFSSSFDIYSRQSMSPYQQQTLMRQNRILSMPR